MRFANRRLILEKIIGSEEISRVELHASTGLTKATVSAIVAELIEDKLVLELGTGNTLRGRKPIRLKFAEHAGIAAGLTIETDEIECVITDLYGKVLISETVEISDFSTKNVLKVIRLRLKELISQCAPAHYSIVGIGCAIPGIVDNKGIIIHAPYIEWQKVDFSNMLSAITGVPVFCDNVANMLAVAEIMHHPEEKAAICLRIRSGIRAGIIINGEIFTGGDGFAGEVGHMPIEANGVLCRCGQYGCWETRASELALMKTLSDSGVTVHKKNDPPIAVTEPVRKIFSDYAGWLASGLIFLINMFNPGHKTNNSPLISRNDIIVRLLNEELKNRLHTQSLSSCRLELSKAPKNASSIGAAIIAADKFISRMSLSRHNHKDA